METGTCSKQEVDRRNRSLRECPNRSRRRHCATQRHPDERSYGRVIARAHPGTRTRSLPRSSRAGICATARCLKPFGLGIASEQFLHRKEERLVLIKNGVDLIDDRCFHADPARTLECALCCRYPFCHHSHIGLDLSQGLGPAQPFSYSPIATVLTEAGRDQISHAAQSVESARVSTHPGSETQQFGHRSGKERSF